MNFEKIYKWSLFYDLLRSYGRVLHNYIFYRKVYVNGIENIPDKTPLILTANHQNALMDAMALIFAADHQPVFLARSDIFSKPIIAKILRSFKIMPVYRIRDGIKSLGKNDEIFNYSVQVLKNNKRLAIMPEGNHGNRRKLRMLKKGVARIAFRAEEVNNFELGLNIIPVGIDYSNYTNFRNSLFINFGKPFTIKEFKDIYEENPKKAFLLFNEKLKKELSQLMIDIQNDEYYDTFYNMRELYNTAMRKKLGLVKNNLKSRFFAGKSIISLLEKAGNKAPDELKWLKEKDEELQKGLKLFKLRHWILEKKKFSYLALIFQSVIQIVFLPVHIYGIITNYLPYKIPVWITNKIKDKQFVSSVKYVLLLIIFLIFYLIEYLIFALFAESVWIRNVFLLSLPIAGYFTIENWILFKKLKSKWIYNIAISSRNKKLIHITDLYKSIMHKMDELASKYSS
ncbi:MAG: hypothetical protein GXO79_12120 [Chlorobi bacterium]|nr:hypothetical protein [Chlorobiota bacterium]